MSSKSVLQECHVRVSEKKCQVTNVKQEVSSKSVLQKCQVRVSYKSVVSSKSVGEECQSSKNVSQECQVRVSEKSVK